MSNLRSDALVFFGATGELAYQLCRSGLTALDESSSLRTGSGAA
jgi:hypothetical protein